MNRTFNSLQALRGLAALLVLLFHYRFYLRGDDTSGTSIWDALFGWGIIGVDIFFVISGFIMVYTTRRQSAGFASSKRFLINRAIRIIPLYYFGLLIAFLLGGSMSTFHYPDKVQDLFSALTFSVFRTDITPHYINDGGMYNIRWTLNYEIYFYLVFSLCMFVRHRMVALLGWGALATCIIPVLAGFHPTLNAKGYPVETPLYGLLSNPVILEFLMGAIMGYAYLWIEKNISSAHLPLVSALVSLVILLSIIWGLYTRDIHALNVKTTLLISAFVLTLTLAEPVLSKLYPKVLIYLGNISFSLYLLHSSIGQTIFKRFGPANVSVLNTVMAVIVAILVSILAAHFSHKYIEVKFTRWLKRKCLPVRETKASVAPLEPGAR